VLAGIRDAEDGRLTDRELTDNLILLVAGFETTTNLLGNGVQVVLTEPEPGAVVRSGSVAPAAFVEEVLRFDSPVQATSRRKDGASGVGGLGHRAALARLEGTIAFPRLLRRFPVITPAGRPERRAGVVLRGFETLPVSLG
jgi:cytochrome P450